MPRFASAQGRKVPPDVPIYKFETGDWRIKYIHDENGSWDGVHAALYIRCPESETIRLPLSTDPDEDPRRGLDGTYWHWDGDSDRPTIKPSIGVGGGSRWHGWLTRGDLEAAE